MKITTKTSVSFLLFLGIVSILSIGCKTENGQYQWLKQLTSEEKWVHSYEDDKNGWQAYRPSSYAFPPARGRKAFKILKDGYFADLPISPRDGNSELTGKWSLVVGQQVLSINLDNGQAFKLVIEEAQEDLIWISRNEE